MSHKMLEDAIRFSSYQQLVAIFDSVNISVYMPHEDFRAYCRNVIEIRCDIIHRGKSYGYVGEFPIAFVDGSFYDGYLREQFPRKVAREIIDYVMRESL